MNISTHAGFRNITPAELSALAPRPRIIDVREPEELTGELGHGPLDGGMRAYVAAGLPVERG